jgi:hypothetical protein
MVLKLGHFGKADQKYLKSFEMCWRRMEKINWTYRVRNEEVLRRVTEKMSILHTVKECILIGLVTFCIGTALRNTLLMKRLKEG